MSFYFFIFFFILIKCSEKSDNSKKDERKLQSEKFSNLRIYVDYKCLISSPNKTNSNDPLKNAIEKAKSTLEKLIKVESVVAPIYLPNYRIENILPEGFSGCTESLYEAKSADLIIFIRDYSSQYDSGKNLDIISSQIINYVDDNPSNRPLIGTVIYNYRPELDDNESKLQAMSTLFLHAFTHILGFNLTILKNKNLIYTDDHYKNRMNYGQRRKLFVNGTKVMEVAKKYFNCTNSSFIGVELDYENGKEVSDGNSVHWSERILLGDYMTPELYYPEQAISEITLALLEDLGWYKVNNYTGGLMRFGKNKKCDFLFNDCVKENQNPSGFLSTFENEFCSNIYSGLDPFGTCSSGRQSMGNCSNRYQYLELHQEYIDYRRDNFTIYGSGFSPSKLLEFCPISNSDVKIIDTKYNFKGNCKIGNNRYGKSNEFVIHDYTDTSFCVFSSILNNTRTNPDNVKNVIRANCYKMFCSERSLTIQVENEFIVCPRQGGIINVADEHSIFTGYLICPDYNLICTGSVPCNNLFDCVEKESIVKDTTFYYDYTVNKNVSIEITTNKDNLIRESDVIKEKIYEEGEDGVCPQFCKQCTSNKQCTICDPSYKYFIGTKEGDEEEIKCSKEPPGSGYYKKMVDTKEYYYKCIEDCITCKNASRCEQCIPNKTVDSSDGHCTERIPGCIEYDTNKSRNEPGNGGAKTYYECLSCNNTDNYYCLNGNKTQCRIIQNLNKSLYYDLENRNYPCIRKCQDEYINCETCDSNTCFTCNQTNHFINYKGNCLPNISNCEEHYLNLDVSRCSYCDESNDYYCLEDDRDQDDRTQCQLIKNITSYYRKEDNDNSCLRLCSKEYTDICLACNRTQCIQCQEGYFLFEGRCLQNMTGCIDNKVIEPTTKELSCDECDKTLDYYCINEDKSVCVPMDNVTITMYYELPNLNYSCYSHCENVTEHCIKCNSTSCFQCSGEYATNRMKTLCLIPPQMFKEDEECTINTYTYDNNLDINFDFNKTVKDYYTGLDHISKVEHFVGNNYTITLFMNSNCTEGLLPEGYYKLDTREINHTLIEAAQFDFYYHLLVIYINYNYRSHIRFYDMEQNLMEPNCEKCKDKTFIITNNAYDILKEIIGTTFTDFVIENNLDIFDENSDIYTDTCTNLTLNEIDIPIHLRKELLFLHEYFEPLMCKDIDCVFLDMNLTTKTSTCECKINNNFEKIFQGIKFEFVPYESGLEAKGFSEAIKVIKCMRTGIKWKKFKNNLPAIIVLFAFVLQVLFYIAYGCFGKPLANIPNYPQTLANPPKSDSRTKIYLFSDWNLKYKDIIAEEEKEMVIQPRDDSGDQIMEEEKSINNDFYSDNNISIDTNAGGFFQEKKINRNLKAAEKNKKVLILLGNKSKKKVSIEQSINREVNSESDEIPLAKKKLDKNYGFCRSYWLYLSVKQHLINLFSDITFCNMTETFVPITLRFIRCLFIATLSLILSILWLDQKYFEKKWIHFNEKYSFVSKEQLNKVEISLSERISYAMSNTIVYILVNLLVMLFADFIIGVVFFSMRDEIEKIIEKNKLNKMQDSVLIARRNYNIFYFINFILVVIFFLSIVGFGATYPGGAVDCITIGVFSLILFEIVPFIWSLILALFRYLGYKKKSKCLASFSEFFLY